MKSKKIFIIIITFLISCIILFLVVKYVTTNFGINQGKYRVSDVILTSTAEFVDKTEENKTWSFNVSQKNILSLLVTSQSFSDVKRIYLSDFKVIGKNSYTVFQEGSETKVEVGSTGKDIDLEWVIKDNNQVLIEIGMLNENILNNWNVPEGTKEVRRDGTVFKIAGITLEDLKATVKFKLVIEEGTGKINTMNVKLVIPSKELLENGQDIRRMELSNFVFRVK